MTSTSDPDSVPAPSRRRRGRWVFVLFIGGLLAIPALGAIFNLAAALPWVGLSALCLSLGGFKIWQADHPEADARAALRGWVGRILGGIAGFVALLIALANPALAAVVIVGWVVLMVVLFVVISRVAPSSPRGS